MIKDNSSTPPADSNWAIQVKEILSRYNAEILNKFQDEYLMQKGPGCEAILFPVLEKATKDFINPPDDGIKRDFNLKSFLQLDNNWDKEFDNKIGKWLMQIEINDKTVSYIKDFISSTLQQERQKMIESVEKLKVENAKTNPTLQHNITLDAVLDIIKNKE